MSPEIQRAVEEVFRRVDDTLMTARHGLEDLIGKNPNRQFSGLRNLIVFGRSVTWVLQNLRSIEGLEFDAWYDSKQKALSADPLMKYFVQVRNELEKQGRLSIGTSVHIKSFSSNDIARFGPPPAGAIGFFIGDSAGGTGWEVKTSDGRTEKYYVELPADIGQVRRHFSNFLPKDAPDLSGKSVEELAVQYIGTLQILIREAKEYFLGNKEFQMASGKQLPSHLRVVK